MDIHKHSTRHAAGNAPGKPVALNRRSAFTLVELCVVTGVVTLLAALLLPAFSRAKESARSAACRNNLRQLGLGTSLYSTDAGRLPVMLDWLYARAPGKDWQPVDLASGTLFPYVRLTSSYLCPDQRPMRSKGSSKTRGPADDHSYVMNCMMCHVHDLGACLTPSRSLLFIERTNVTNDLIGGLMSDPSHAAVFQLPIQVPSRHAGRTPVLLIDLHLETRKQFDAVSVAREFWYPNGESSLEGSP